MLSPFSSCQVRHNLPRDAYVHFLVVFIILLLYVLPPTITGRVINNFSPSSYGSRLERRTGRQSLFLGFRYCDGALAYVRVLSEELLTKFDGTVRVAYLPARLAAAAAAISNKINVAYIFLKISG